MAGERGGCRTRGGLARLQGRVRVAPVPDPFEAGRQSPGPIPSPEFEPLPLGDLP